MLIKFKEPDPRAGMVACMDSFRGQQLVDAGAADREVESGAQASKAAQVDGASAGGDQGQAPVADTQAPEAEKPKKTRGSK